MVNTKRKRRPNLGGYKYNIYSQVETLYPVTSDEGERTQIFLTELCRLSVARNLTIGPERNVYIYFKSTHIKAILSHTKYKTILSDLALTGVINRVFKRNIYGCDLFTFAPVFYDPIYRGRRIRNLKVRNGIRRYLGVRSDDIDPYISGILAKSLRSILVKLDEETFFDLASDHYPKYCQEKALTGKKVMTRNHYLELQAERYYSIREFNQLSKPEKEKFVKQDEFAGRIYTIASGLPRWTRPYIYIDGSQVAEIDLRAAHPYLLYETLRDTDFGEFIRGVRGSPDDVYLRYKDLINARSRREAKLRFLRGVYGRLNSKYYSEFKEHFPGAGEILDGIKTSDNVNNPSRGKGNHTNLVYKITQREVKLFTRVWEALDQAGIRFIPLHDAVLIEVARISDGYQIIEKIVRRSIPIAEFKCKIY